MNAVDRLVETLLDKQPEYKKGDHLEMERDGNTWHGVVTAVTRSAGAYNSVPLITMQGRWSTGPRSSTVMEVFADEPGLKHTTDPSWLPTT